MTDNILVYFTLGAAILSIILSCYAIISSRQGRAIKKYFRDANESENLEEVMEQIIEKLAHLDDHAENTTSTLGQMSDQLNTATQYVGVIRYNSNGDDGGNLSFSAALLDAHQSGIVLTSLHGRQSNRIYAKAINEGTSESTLSEEEREALISALTKRVEQAQTSKTKSNRK